MPIYEFKCKGCGKIIEVCYFNLDEDNEKNCIIECNYCGSYELERILSPINFKLIGGIR